MEETHAEGLDTFAAFLRGVNVGGNNTVGMAGLRACLEALGLRDVRTHGNSGNVVFRATPTNPRDLEEDIEKALAADFSIPIRVVVRSYEDMKRTIEAIPGDWVEGTDRKHDIIFLRHPVDSPRLVHELQPKQGIEELLYSPGVLFWSVSRRDFSKSNLSKIVGTKLYQEMTVRGPGTTRKVYELMAALKLLHPTRR